MSNLTFLKGQFKEAEFGDLHKFFKLDGLNLDNSLEITPEFVEEMLELYQFDLAPSSVNLTEAILMRIYKCLGGDENTPLETVMSFMFIALTGPNFMLEDIRNVIMSCIFCNNSFNYLAATQTPVPMNYVSSSLESIGNYEGASLIYSKYRAKLNVSEPLHGEDFKKFMSSLEEQIVEYYKNSQSLDDLINQ